MNEVGPQSFSDGLPLAAVTEPPPPQPPVLPSRYVDAMRAAWDENHHQESLLRDFREVLGIVDHYARIERNLAKERLLADLDERGATRRGPLASSSSSAAAAGSASRYLRDRAVEGKRLSDEIDRWEGVVELILSLCNELEDHVGMYSEGFLRMVGQLVKEVRGANWRSLPPHPSPWLSVPTLFDPKLLIAAKESLRRAADTRTVTLKELYAFEGIPPKRLDLLGPQAENNKTTSSTTTTATSTTTVAAAAATGGVAQLSASTLLSEHPSSSNSAAMGGGGVVGKSATSSLPPPLAAAPQPQAAAAVSAAAAPLSAVPTIVVGDAADGSTSFSPPPPPATTTVRLAVTCCTIDETEAIVTHLFLGTERGLILRMPVDALASETLALGGSGVETMTPTSTASRAVQQSLVKALLRKANGERQLRQRHNMTKQEGAESPSSSDQMTAVHTATQLDASTSAPLLPPRAAPPPPPTSAAAALVPAATGPLTYPIDEGPVRIYSGHVYSVTQIKIVGYGGNNSNNNMTSSSPSSSSTAAKGAASKSLSPPPQSNNQNNNTNKRHLMLVSSSVDKTIRVSNVATGALVSVIGAERSMCGPMGYVPSLDVLVAPYYHGALTLWDPRSGDHRGALVELHVALHSAHVLPPRPATAAAAAASAATAALDASPSSAGLPPPPPAAVVSASTAAAAPSAGVETVELFFGCRNGHIYGLAFEVRPGYGGIMVVAQRSRRITCALLPDCDRPSFTSGSDNRRGAAKSIPLVTTELLQGGSNSGGGLGTPCDVTLLTDPAATGLRSVSQAEQEEEMDRRRGIVRGGHTAAVSMLCSQWPFLYAADDDGVLTKWDVHHKRLEYNTRGHGDRITSLFVTSDGFLCTSSWDGLWCIRMAETGALLHRSCRHYNKVTGLVAGMMLPAQKAAAGTNGVSGSSPLKNPAGTALMGAVSPRTQPSASIPPSPAVAASKKAPAPKPGGKKPPPPPAAATTNAPSATPSSAASSSLNNNSNTSKSAKGNSKDSSSSSAVVAPFPPMDRANRHYLPGSREAVALTTTTAATTTTQQQQVGGSSSLSRPTSASMLSGSCLGLLPPAAVSATTTPHASSSSSSSMPVIWSVSRDESIVAWSVTVGVDNDPLLGANDVF